MTDNDGFREAGLDFTCIVKVEVFLLDIQRYDELNEFYKTIFQVREKAGFFISSLHDPFRQPPNEPARVVLSVSALPLLAQIEVSAMAIKPEPQTCSGKPNGAGKQQQGWETAPPPPKPPPPPPATTTTVASVEKEGAGWGGAPSAKSKTQRGVWRVAQNKLDQSGSI